MNWILSGRLVNHSVHLWLESFCKDYFVVFVWFQTVLERRQPEPNVTVSSSECPGITHHANDIIARSLGPFRQLGRSDHGRISGTRLRRIVPRLRQLRRRGRRLVGFGRRLSPWSRDRRPHVVSGHRASRVGMATACPDVQPALSTHTSLFSGRPHTPGHYTASHW